MNDDLWIFAGSAKTTDAKDKEPVVMHAPAGNMFWADDQSGQNLDIQFAVNGKKSPSLPKEFTPKATLIPNSLEDTCNSLELYVNGQNFTLLEKIPTEGLKAPGDLRAAMLTCPLKPSSNKLTMKVDENSDNEYLTIIKASDSLVLPENKLGETYNIDDMPESVISAIYETLANNSLLQNTVATSLNEANNQYKLFDFYKNKYGFEAAKGYLKELMVNGRFTVKKMSQWGGALGIAFKGNARSRKFLTSVNYGIFHDKVSVLKTYIEVSAGNTRAAFAESIPSKPSGIIGFVFALSFDVYDFFEKDIGEQNIAAFAGALGVTTLKVTATSFSAIGATGLLIAIWGAVSTAVSLPAIPAIIVLGLGAIATISFGYFFDRVDNSSKYKERTMEFLEQAFPDFNTENILDYFFADSVNELIQEQENRINRYEYEQAMRGSGMFGF